MKTKNINFSKDFTDCPGGRYRHQGEFSGEQFREDFLTPALQEFDLVILDLNGAYGFPSSFIDEAFGLLVDKFGFEGVSKKLQIQISDDDLAKEEIQNCIRAHRV